MKTILESVSRCLCLAITSVALFACGGEDAPDDGPSGSGSGGTGAMQCESFASEHDELINAPTNAVVVKKVPRVPADDQ